MIYGVLSSKTEKSGRNLKYENQTKKPNARTKKLPKFQDID